MDERILAVQKMQVFIAENLGEEINLAKLAEVSLFPPGTPTGCSESILA